MSYNLRSEKTIFRKFFSITPKLPLALGLIFQSGHAMETIDQEQREFKLFEESQPEKSCLRDCCDFIIQSSRDILDKSLGISNFEQGLQTIASDRNAYNEGMMRDPFIIIGDKEVDITDWAVDFTDSNLTILPTTIGNLCELQVLELSHNQLTTLPYEIGNLGELRYLTLDRNPLKGNEAQWARTLENDYELDAFRFFYQTRGDIIIKSGLLKLAYQCDSNFMLAGFPVEVIDYIRYLYIKTRLG